MAEFPKPSEGIALTHFIVSADVERSRRFYADVLGGETVRKYADCGRIARGQPVRDRAVARKAPRSSMLGRSWIVVSSALTRAGW